MYKNLSRILRSCTAWLLAVQLVLVALFSAVPVYAGSLAKNLVRFDRMAQGTATTGTVCAQPVTVATEASVQVTFPTGFVVSTVVANWAVSTATTTGWPSGAVAWPGIGTATAAAGQVVTFPSGDLTVGTLYCFNWTNTAAISQPASAAPNETGTITTRTSAPANIDTGSWATATLGANADQITVSAVVPPSFVFTLSGNSDAFVSNLAPNTLVSTSGINVTITTNANNGWMVWAKDANSSGGKGALKSATAANYMITSPNALGSAAHAYSGTGEDYGTGVTVNTDAAGGGSVAADAAYDGTASKLGVLDPATLRTIATASPVSGNGTANGDIITLTERAGIAGNTPAANDYSDTITVVGAGNF